MLGDLADSRDNNLRIVRLVAASAVIFSHAYVVNIGLAALKFEPLGWLTGIDCGQLAVDVFFIVSGFLVSRSLLRGGDVFDYVMSRVLRIYPALIVAVLLSALVLGPLVTILPLGEYFRAKALYAYVAVNSTMLNPLRMLFALPGVFPANPYPDVVNASLWTLPWEIWMYITLLGLFFARALGRFYPIVLAAIALAYAAVSLGWWTPAGPYWTLAIRFLAFFHAGVAGYIYRKRIPVSATWLGVASVAMLAVGWATQSAVLLPLWLGYAVMMISYDPRIVAKRWSAGADYSYGMYIYAYAVQQTIVFVLGPMGVVPHTILAVALTFPLAVASWHFIEEPALRLKKRLRAWHHRRSGAVTAP